ncbi:hypothetical protein Ddye_000782 [Dipteronia dyeriana]|uniref:CRAL-TRIO domain-containing protein n=1 Tax=Dipteronia dyeriana TaxID=168575 RepID=A0AAD9XMY8_9ROSI|nr:hypothetical protein Ddye_000782 [Dipteronia dyeriana]
MKSGGGILKLYFRVRDRYAREKTVERYPVRRKKRETRGSASVLYINIENMMKSIIIESDKTEDSMRHNADEETMEKNDKEQAKLRLMRTLVQRHNPSSKEVDDLMLRRFLRARDLDIEKGSIMFLKYLKWRRSFVPNGSISPSEVPNEIAQNKMFLQGFDKKDRPIGVVFVARRFQNKQNQKEFKRFPVYVLEKLSEKIPAGQEKFVVIVDIQGRGYANSDIRAYIGALSILQEHYPERLGKLLILHAPYIFMTVWKIVYPFIDNNTKKKIVFADDKELKSTLLEEIDESQIPEIYGGQLPLIPIHET